MEQCNYHHANDTLSPSFLKQARLRGGNRTEAIRNQTRTQKKANQLCKGPSRSQADIKKSVRRPLWRPSFPFHFVDLKGRQPSTYTKQVKTSQLLFNITGTRLSPSLSSRPLGPPSNPTRPNSQPSISPHHKPPKITTDPPPLLDESNP